MRAISIFSIAFLSLSIWSLFFAVSHLKSENQLEAEVTSEVIQDINQEDLEEEKISIDKSEDSAEQDEQESDETVIVKQTPENIELPVFTEEDEEKPTTIVALASSRYNDILYDFEKDNPISVDDLLQILLSNN